MASFLGNLEMLSVQPDGPRWLNAASTASHFEPLFDQASKHAFTPHTRPKVCNVVPATVHLLDETHDVSRSLRKMIG